MQEDISIWGLIDRPISVTEASILWCNVHPPAFFSPAKAEIWVTNTYEYNQVFPRIAKFFKHREEPLKIRKILEHAILEKELHADIWDCSHACVYPYENFNHDLTTILIDDLAQWAIKKDLNPRFLLIPITRFKKVDGKIKVDGKKKNSKPHKEFVKKTFDDLVFSTNNKLPTFKEVIRKMIEITEAEENGEEYYGMIIDYAPSEDLWVDSSKIKFTHNVKGGKYEMSIKTLKNYLTILRKEYLPIS